MEEQKADVSMTLPILVKLFLGLQVDVDRRKSPVNIQRGQVPERKVPLFVTTGHLCFHVPLLKFIDQCLFSFHRAC